MPVKFFLIIAIYIAMGLLTRPAIASPFSAFDATYAITKQNEVIANTLVSLKKVNDSDWKYQSTSKPTSWIANTLGITVTETSFWRWNHNHIRVKEYHYNRSGKEKKVQLRFDWNNMTVVNTIDGDDWKMSMPEGTLDKLSINLGLTAHLSGKISDISFPVADGGKLKYYDFTILSREQIETSIGKINTVKVMRNKRSKNSRPTTLWMAPELNFLLVRKEKKDKDGESVVLEIRSFNQHQ